MLTPDDMQKKIFALGKRIENNDVGMFVKELQINYQFLYNEISEQKKQIKGMEAKLQHYRKIENSLQEAMVSAQNVSEEKIAKAERKAREIEKNAYKKADNIISDAKNELESIKKDIENFNNAYVGYQKKYREFVNGQIRFIEEAERFIQDEDILSSFDVGKLDNYEESPINDESDSYSDKFDYEDKDTEDDSVNFNLDLSDDSNNETEDIDEEEETIDDKFEEEDNEEVSNELEEEDDDDDDMEESNSGEYANKDALVDEDTRAVDEYLSNNSSFDANISNEETVEDDKDINEQDLNDGLNLTPEKDNIKTEFIKSDLMSADFMKEKVLNNDVPKEETISDSNNDLEVDEKETNNVVLEDIVSINTNDNEEIPIRNTEEQNLFVQQPKEESLEDILDSVTSDEKIELDIKNDANNNMVDDSIEVDFKGEYGKEIEREASFELPTLDMDSMGFDDLELDDSISSLPDIEMDNKAKEIDTFTPNLTPNFDNESSKPSNEPNLSINDNISLVNINQSLFSGAKKKVDKNAEILRSMNLTSSKEERKENLKNYEKVFSKDLLASNMAMMNSINNKQELQNEQARGLGNASSSQVGGLQGLGNVNSSQGESQGLGNVGYTQGGLQGLGGNNPAQGGLQGNSTLQSSPLGGMPSGGSLPSADSVGRKPMF